MGLLALVCILLQLSLVNKSTAQCSVVSSHGWTATITLTPVDVVPSTTNCPWSYNYDVEFNYDVVFTGSASNRSITAQVYFNCTGGSGGTPFKTIGTFTADASGTTATGNNSRGYNALGVAYNYGSNPSCTTIQISDVGCNSYTLTTYGSGVTNNSQSCSSSNGTLPVELLRFEAKRQATGVEINWATVSEKNNDFFSIERSADGEIWDVIKFADGAGMSNELIEYSHIDALASNAAAYYRLKQTDYDGTASYSRTVFVSSEDFILDFAVYPVPADDVLNIGFCEHIHNLEIYSAQGQRISETLYQSNRCEVTTSQLANGTYILIAQSGDERISKYFTVAH